MNTVRSSADMVKGIEVQTPLQQKDHQQNDDGQDNQLGYTLSIYTDDTTEQDVRSVTAIGTRNRQE